MHTVLKLLLFSTSNIHILYEFSHTHVHNIIIHELFINAYTHTHTYNTGANLTNREVITDQNQYNTKSNNNNNNNK